ncbi:MAG: NifU family protein [Bacilli bacterium]|nr:NifU family protein [Bacilli bacterium]
MIKMNIEERIIEVIDKIRPFLVSDGGNVEFVKYEDNIAYIKLMGHCSHCPMMDITLKEGIEVAITNEIPEVKEVRNVTE